MILIIDSQTYWLIDWETDTQTDNDIFNMKQKVLAALIIFALSLLIISLLQEKLKIFTKTVLNVFVWSVFFPYLYFPFLSLSLSIYIYIYISWLMWNIAFLCLMYASQMKSSFTGCVHNIYMQIS